MTVIIKKRLRQEHTKRKLNKLCPYFFRYIIYLKSIYCISCRTAAIFSHIISYVTPLRNHTYFTTRKSHLPAHVSATDYFNFLIKVFMNMPEVVARKEIENHICQAHGSKHETRIMLCLVNTQLGPTWKQSGNEAILYRLTSIRSWKNLFVLPSKLAPS